MNMSESLRVLALLAACALIAACATQESAANRGKFGEGSCKADGRVAVDAQAAYAQYLDKDGNPLSAGIIEDLKGAKSGMMCPVGPKDPADPAPCPVGFCPRLMSGKTYCLRC